MDEEEALGFHVWVAELELLVGTSKGRQANQVCLFQASFVHCFIREYWKLLSGSKLELSQIIASFSSVLLC